MKRISFIFSIVCIVLLSFTTSCFAVSYQDPYDIEGINYRYKHYVVYENEAGKNLYLYVTDDETISNSIKFNMVDTGSANVFYVDFTGETIGKFSYKLLDNNTWGDGRFSNIASHTAQFAIPPNHQNPPEFLGSSKDVYNADGTIFFTPPPVTLLTETLEMIAVETPVAGQQVVGTMGTLLLCGVGCLMLLVALPLLSRVFSRYRR